MWLRQLMYTHSKIGSTIDAKPTFMWWLIDWLSSTIIILFKLISCTAILHTLNVRFPYGNRNILSVHTNRHETKCLDKWFSGRNRKYDYTSSLSSSSLQTARNEWESILNSSCSFHVSRKRANAEAFFNLNLFMKIELEDLSEQTQPIIIIILKSEYYKRN